MRGVRDLVGVAIAGLTARWSRTLLIMLGPIIGVSAIVAAVGLTESAKGDLQQTLAALGDNLIRAEAATSFGADTPVSRRCRRPDRLATVEGSTATVRDRRDHHTVRGGKVLHRLPDAGVDRRRYFLDVCRSSWFRAVAQQL